MQTCRTLRTDVTDKPIGANERAVRAGLPAQFILQLGGVRAPWGF
jgi:hypothetical protein